MKPRRNNHNDKGLTLLEVLVVVAIIAVIAGVAYPTFRSMGANMRVKAAARRLYGDLQLAKMRAIEKSTSHTVIFGQTVSNIIYDYVIIEDRDHNEPPAGTGFCECECTACGGTGNDVIVNKTIIGDEFKGVSISGNTLGTNNDSPPLHVIRFDTRGFPRNNSGGFGAGTVTFTNQYGNTAQVIITSLGKIKLVL